MSFEDGEYELTNPRSNRSDHYRVSSTGETKTFFNAMEEKTKAEIVIRNRDGSKEKVLPVLIKEVSLSDQAMYRSGNEFVRRKYGVNEQSEIYIAKWRGVTGKRFTCRSYNEKSR